MSPVRTVVVGIGEFADVAVLSLCGADDSVDCQSRVTVIGTEGVLIAGMWGKVLQIIFRDKPWI